MREDEEGEGSASEMVKTGDGSAKGTNCALLVLGELGTCALVEPSTDENLQQLRSCWSSIGEFCGLEDE